MKLPSEGEVNPRPHSLEMGLFLRRIHFEKDIFSIAGGRADGIDSLCTADSQDRSTDGCRNISFGRNNLYSCGNNGSFNRRFNNRFNYRFFTRTDVSGWHGN